VEHLVSSLGLPEGRTVLDLGAGTGKLTRLLASHAKPARIVAVEPVAAMRRKLTENVPEATVLDGTAEAIPLEAGSVGVVVVAQAFHWFDGDRALREIRRVLEPGGRLGLVWNVRDESVGWVAELTRLIDAHESGEPRYRTGRWREAFDRTKDFTPLESARFGHVHRGPREMIVDRVSSISFIAALPHEEHEAVLQQVRGLVDLLDAEVELPYRTDVFVCRRLDRIP
jgi:SAM-dependent methyltransferase